MKESFVLHEEDLQGLAIKTVEILLEINTDRAKVLLLEGDLGAGKTTFVKELAHVLGVEKENVNSPTFILKKTHKARHPLFKKLVHVDAYRFNHPSEAKILRLEEDLKEKDSLVAIEWPSKMNYIKSDIEISFNVFDEKTRDITISYEK